MTTPLDKPIAVSFDSKEQFAAVMFALDKFADFCESKGHNDDAIMVRNIISRGMSQWDCGDPDCKGCNPIEEAHDIIAVETQDVGIANLLRILGMPPAGEA